MENSLRIFASLLALFLLSGCETLAYYFQAVGGQLDILARARPAAELVRDPATPQALRERLEIARAIRDYAVSGLKLPDNASYRNYADIGRPYAVWNVVAAPEFSREPLRSCFPVAGCVSCRGFFAQQDAERHAAGLRAQGYDVHVQGVPAYSTLGHFDDPLLSTFILNSDTELARLIFHELAHQVVYVKDDSTFNESFAVAVEREGVRRWLAATGREALMKEYLAREIRNKAFRAAIDQAQARLQALYRTRLAPEAMRLRKHAEFERLRLDVDGLGFRYRALREANNAVLASFATYAELVPTFERLLQEASGDLEKFYAKVKALAEGGWRGFPPAPSIEPSNRGPLSKPSP